MFTNEKKKLNSLMTEGVWYILEECKCFIAGGAITSLFTSNDVNDIDVYFRSEEDLIKAIKEFYITPDSCGDVSSHELSCNNYTNKSILWDNKGQKVQFIYFDYFDSLESVFDSFDFTVCMGGYDCQTKEFVFHEDFFKHNSQRYLKYNPNTAFPLLSMLRISKYNDKGYSISKSEYLRALLNCLKLNIESWDDLKEHIGGMYGLDMDNIFDEEQEFSLESAVSSLSSIYNDIPSVCGKSVSLMELLVHIKKEQPRFYKWVVPTDGTLLSPTRKFPYEVGITVNGGDNGIYCCYEHNINYHYAKHVGRVMIELVPDKGKWEMNEAECQLFGDVLVKRVVPQDEYENDNFSNLDYHG